MVTYTQGKQQSKLIISIANDASGAKARADQLAKHFKQTGDCTPAPELGEGGIRAQNSFEGRMIARTRGRHLIILLNPATDGPELLKTTAQNLP